MSKILMLYGTTDGHTEKIAQRIAKAAREQGCSVEVINAGKMKSDPRPESYDAVLVAAIHDSVCCRGDSVYSVRSVQEMGDEANRSQSR